MREAGPGDTVGRPVPGEALGADRGRGRGRLPLRQRLRRPARGGAHLRARGGRRPDGRRGRPARSPAHGLVWPGRDLDAWNGRPRPRPAPRTRAWSGATHLPVARLDRSGTDLAPLDGVDVWGCPAFAETNRGLSFCERGSLLRASQLESGLVEVRLPR
ncbi:hypothetical protein NKG94_16750 [Micromonospora sp. M12]